MMSFAIRNSLIVLSLFLLLTLANPVTAAVPIKNIPPTPHGAPAGTPLVDITAAITQAANALGWTVTEAGPGSLTASVWVRQRHHAIVRIGYDHSNYWIEYLDSENLSYTERVRRSPGPRGKIMKGPRIHPNYNIWVRSLAKEIEAHAPNPPRAAEPDAVSARELPLVSDELEKLDALRERGVLTQDEFDQQKTRLLAR